jgi:hypothetical protein
VLAPFWAGPETIVTQRRRRDPQEREPRRDPMVRPTADLSRWTAPAEDRDREAGASDRPTGLRSLLEEGSTRLGHAIADELRRQAEQTDEAYDRNVKRR